MKNPRWLEPDQLRDWRAYVEGSIRLHELMNHELKTGHGLSESEYEILVRLSEAPQRRMRMAELADAASQSRSRLSHTCARLESKNLVRRDTCQGDKRGVFAVLTDEGFTVLERAAIDHVETVREFFIDQIEPGDLETIGRAFRNINQRIADVR